MEQSLGDRLLFIGILLLIAFPIIETRWKTRCYRCGLFKIRVFSLANTAGFLGAIARGGMMFLLIMMLQGIWLPLHGYSYESTPFWAGVFHAATHRRVRDHGPALRLAVRQVRFPLVCHVGMLLIALSFLILLPCCLIISITRSLHLHS